MELLAYVGLMLDSIAIRVIEINVERRLNASIRKDVEKSSYHQLSQTEIASDNPCYRQPSCDCTELFLSAWIASELTVIRPR